MGFEPTRTNTFELESNPLDRSGTNATLTLQQLNKIKYIKFSLRNAYSEEGTKVKNIPSLPRTILLTIGHDKRCGDVTVPVAVWELPVTTR